MLEVLGAACGYHGLPGVRELSFTVGPGEGVCILGANGIGKTTVFKTILRSLPLLEGKILLDGRDIKELTSRQRAQKLGYVPQAHVPPFPYTVLEVVTTGRTAHLSVFSAPSPRTIIWRAPRWTAWDRPSGEPGLYGAQRRGTPAGFDARARWCSTPEILIMDEPTSNLDFGNQLRMLRLIRKLAAEGLSVLLTTHYPEHVLNCATKVVVLYGQERFAVGPPDKMITADTLRDLYRVETEVRRIKREGGHAAVCIPWIEEEAL
jgi:iron complex transport system ATP-binding protein